jgi:hypothetical protein
LLPCNFVAIFITAYRNAEEGFPDHFVRKRECQALIGKNWLARTPPKHEKLVIGVLAQF